MNDATRRYILAHAGDDVRQLALRGCKEEGIDLPCALLQIQGRQTARRKLPLWADTDGIVYPQHLSLEQCSSELTARYKAQIASELLQGEGSTGLSDSRKLIDLTGGFGVDFVLMSAVFDEAVYVERQEELCVIASHNIALLKATSCAVTTVCADAVEYLHLADTATMVFIDPARRDTHGQRTYGIADCTPDVLPLIDELLRKARYVLLKLSPMLDWRKAVSDVGADRVRQVHIVAVGGECKELLLLLSAKGSGQARLFCVNDGRREVFELSDSSAIRTDGVTDSTAVPPAVPQSGDYLYEPHAALMKGGVFNELARRYHVTPIAANSHLFIASHRVADFPGRCFELTAVSSMNKQELREKVLPLGQANISVRNFPMTVDALRKRLRLGEGGSSYLFATTLANGEKVLLVGERR